MTPALTTYHILRTDTDAYVVVTPSGTPQPLDDLQAALDYIRWHVTCRVKCQERSASFAVRVSSDDPGSLVSPEYLPGLRGWIAAHAMH